MKIRFDAGRAKLIGFNPLLINKIKENCLSWINKKIEIKNTMKRSSPYYRYENPIKYCFDLKSLTFPSGLIPRVLTYLEDSDIKVDLEFAYDPFSLEEVPPSPDWIYKHQQDIIDNFLQYRRCCISSPTGSGKSTAIALIIDKFKDKNVLVVLHQIDLMQDLKEDIESYLDEEVGFIGDGISKICRVTVASGRSLYEHSFGKYLEYLQSIDVLIFDEAHHYANATGEAISLACSNTSYRLGLSATLRIETGAGLVLEGVIGPTTLVIPESVVIDLGLIHYPNVYFIPIADPQVKLPPKSSNDYKPERSLVVKECLILNKNRNQIIANIAAYYSHYNPNGCALIVVEDVKYGHGTILQDLLLAQGLTSLFIQGATKREERQEVVRQLKAGELKVLIATKILNEGKDIPNLELMINAAGGSGERGIVQKAGRVLRVDKSGRKKKAIIVDFLDAEPYYLQSNSISRIQHLNKRYKDCCKIITLDALYEKLKPEQ
jgi:superfamily II DNA or RNA helicase